MSVKIPKIIFQEWMAFPNSKGKCIKKPIPSHWESSPESIKEYMPDWKHVIIDNDIADHIVNTYFPDFVKTYNSFEYPIMKVDAIRYLWLYKYGGVYMDLDVELTHSLDDLFYDDHDFYVVQSGNVGSIYTNSFIASKPGCKIWLDCIEEMKKPYSYWAYGKHFKVMDRTGPLMLTRVIKKNKYKYDIGIIPRKLVMPCSICETKPCTKPGAYTKALEGSSWCGWDSMFYNACICNWKLIFVLVVLITILLIFYLFY